MLATTHDVRVIADHIAPERQGWTREVTVETLGHKVRATVYRDSYDFQSRIHVEVWSQATLSWNKVRTLTGDDHKDLPSSSLLGGFTAPEFMERNKRKVFDGTADLVDELIAYAQEVLS